MVLIIDNYDSFTYNLVHRIGEVAPAMPVRVVRNDRITVPQAAQLRPTRIVISPGPCTPRESGVSNDLIRHFAPSVPILGVCLGHQCIAAAFGGRIVRAERVVHGKTDRIHHDGRTVYAGLPNPFVAARYHSLIIAPDSLDETFEVTSRTERDEIMGIRHRSWPLEGVQFHPESFMTEQGHKLLANFLRN